MTLSEVIPFARRGLPIRRDVWSPDFQVEVDYLDLFLTRKRGTVPFPLSLDDLVATDWVVIAGNAGVTPEIPVG